MFIEQHVFTAPLRHLAIELCLLVLVTAYGLHPWFSTAHAQATPQTSSRQTFRAGAATSNITLPLGTSINGLFRDRKATQINDELHARALVLDDGNVRLAMVIVDNCLIPREIYDAAKERVHELTGMPVGHMLMAATHTHSGPTVAHVFQSIPDEEYIEFLKVRIADAVVRAMNNLEPARLGWGVGQVPDQVFNRRWYMKEGAIPPNPFGEIDKVKTNPPPSSSDLIKPAGPTDPSLPIVAVQSRDGRPIALLANYALHYVGGTGSGHISADYFGMFAERMEELLKVEHLDPPFVGMMSNGTSGDINNINFCQERQRKEPYEQMRLVANEIAEEAFRTYKQIAYQDWVPLDVRQTELELGVRHPNQEEVRRAKRIVMAAGGPAMQSAEEVYARETLFLNEYPVIVSLILQALQIGDLAITAIPCEVFVEIGLELKQRSPFETTFTIELANGYNGYLPTPKHHELGGYETWRARSSYLEVGASPKVVEALVALLHDLKRAQ